MGRITYYQSLLHVLYASHKREGRAKAHVLYASHKREGRAKAYILRCLMFASSNSLHLLEKDF